MMSNFSFPKTCLRDSSGNALVGAKLYFFEVGTTTLKNTYQDYALTVPNTNPVLTGSDGFTPPVFLAADGYKIMATDADDVALAGYSCDEYWPSNIPSTALIEALSNSSAPAILATNTSTGPAISSVSTGSGPSIEITPNTGPAITITDASSLTSSAERMSAQAAPTAVGYVGDRYTDSQGRVRTCRVTGTPGTFKAIGALQTRQVLTASSGTYTTPAGVTAIDVTNVAGGGGGGGSTAAGSIYRLAAGAGGASGGVSRKLILAPAASYAFTVGSGGTAGNGTTPTNGGAGGDTTFDSATVVAKGGGGGATGSYIVSNANSDSAAKGGSPASSGAAGDVTTYGSPGGNAFCLSAIAEVGGSGSFVHIHAGNGASSSFGCGGHAAYGFGVVGAGVAASGHGAGGSGASSANANANGGAGSAGCIIVDEYY
jgi:hypothetical protein